MSPLEAAIHYYASARYHPHYVIGHDGTLVAICDEDVVAWHVGLSQDQRELLTDGRWRELVAHPELWDRAWKPHGVLSPAQLWPGTSPNRAYLGVELVPLAPADRGRDGLWFSPAQHHAVAELAADILARHAIAPVHGCVVGHEDLTPVARWDKGGGWDPGARRERPRFDWGRVLARLGLG